MADFVKVATIHDIADPGQLLVEAEDRMLVLFRVGNDVFALDDICTHDNGPLSEGEFSGDTIACPRHGAKFDIKTGAAISMPATKGTVSHEVKIENDEILVRIID